jgi:DNA-directed RNA polymerase specialized sigma24 family protein
MTEPPAARGLTRDYRRKPEVEAEIASLADAGDAAFYSAVEQAQADETLVYGIRKLLRCGRADEAKQLAQVLLARATPLIAWASGSQFPESQADRKDTMQMAGFQLWREVYDLSPKEEFWEVNFTRMVFRACSDAADSIRGPRANERQFHRGIDGEGDEWDEEDSVPALDVTASDLLVPEALAQLDGDVRRAMYLHLQGFKEKSKNPSEPTISTILGVSDRTVRKYLREGEDRIRAWWQQKEARDEQQQ